MEIDRIAEAKKIISKIIYITIATVSKDAEPWNTPVTAAFDEQYNFYWTSMSATQHSQNIRANPNIFIVIYDSTASSGSGGGVYLKAKAVELSNLEEIAQAAAYVYTRKNKTVKDVEEFIGESPKRMYKAVPEKVWVNLDIDVKNDPMNVRKEITLV